LFGLGVDIQSFVIPLIFHGMKFPRRGLITTVFPLMDLSLVNKEIWRKPKKFIPRYFIF
jgi:hypothetical protein